MGYSFFEAHNLCHLSSDRLTERERERERERFVAYHPVDNKMFFIMART
jgi:hypothetical protein